MTGLITTRILNEKKNSQYANLDSRELSWFFGAGSILANLEIKSLFTTSSQNLTRWRST